MSQLKQFSERSLTTYYISALMTIACLALGSHLLQLSAIRDKDGIAAIINISGRQRMLSQRIASLAGQYRLGDNSAREDLLKAIPEFQTAHEALAAHYATSTSNAANARLLHQLYFEGPDSVDSQMREFIQIATRIANASPGDTAIPALSARLFAQARYPLLDSLDRIVAIHQSESESLFAELRQLQWILLIILFCTLLLEARFIFYPMVRKIVGFASEILRLASTDPLTDAVNRRGFFDSGTLEFDRLLRYNRPLCLIILDIDHFKRINDAYGHAAGDSVLKSVVATLRQNLRPTDILGRLGGEEFAILATETNLDGASILAERLRLAIEKMQVGIGNLSVSCTISLGVAQVTSQSGGIDEALEVADSRMYRAKQAGRNRVGGHSITIPHVTGNDIPDQDPADQPA